MLEAVLSLAPPPKKCKLVFFTPLSSVTLKVKFDKKNKGVVILVLSSCSVDKWPLVIFSFRKFHIKCNLLF